MNSEELARLNALAREVVGGRPVAAAVEYDDRTARLSVHLQSQRSLERQDCSPTVTDYIDLEAYVRRQVAQFVAKMED